MFLVCSIYAWLIQRSRKIGVNIWCILLTMPLNGGYLNKSVLHRLLCESVQASLQRPRRSPKVQNYPAQNSARFWVKLPESAMPIMASHARSDARGTARLLATHALASIGNPKLGEPEEITLNNMYRLLQSFRRDAFFGREVSGETRPRSPAEKLTLRPPVERNVREVRRALEEAASTAFKGQSQDEAIDAVERVLRWIAYPKKNDRPSEVDRTRTVSFFRELIGRL
jgi:hypothetical protein